MKGDASEGNASAALTKRLGGKCANKFLGHVSILGTIIEKR